jgi:PAS domain S-box-containing protein
MLDSLVREAVKLVQAESGYAGLIDNGKILATPYLHRDTRIPVDATLALGDTTLPGFVCRTRHVCVFNESDNSPRIPGAVDAGHAPRNVVCVPIIAGTGETLGFIEINNKSAANDFDADDCRKLVSASNSAALAIQNAKSFRKIRDAEALLSDETVILEAIARRRPLDQILQIIVNVVETRCPGIAACIIRREDRGHPGYMVCSPSLGDAIHPTPELYRQIDEYLGDPDNGDSGFIPAAGLVSAAGPLYAIKHAPAHAYIGPVGSVDAGARDILLLTGDADVLTQARISTVPDKIRHLARIALERWSSEQDLQIRDQAMSSTMNAILLIDHQNPGFPVIYANTAAESLIRPSAGTLMGQSMTTLLSGVGGKQSSAIEKALHYRQHAYATIEREQADADSQWIEVYVTPVHGRHHAARHSIAIMNDITERVLAQRELAQSRETLRALSDHLQTVREHEKAGLARELHDELGSMLTTLKIDASSIKDQVGRDPDAARSSAEAIVDTVHDAIATVRRISTGLRPPVLDSLGLVPAIEWQLDQFEKRTGITVDRHISEDIRVSDGHYSIAIFRILQEGLTNITRHAQANRVSIVLIVDNHQVALDIIDDGVGFVVKAEETGASYGLYSMQERALALGGRIDILSRPGEGTRLRVRVPLPAADNPPAGVRS